MSTTDKTRELLVGQLTIDQGRVVLVQDASQHYVCEDGVDQDDTDKHHGQVPHIGVGPLSAVCPIARPSVIGVGTPGRADKKVIGFAVLAILPVRVTAHSGDVDMNQQKTRR